MYTLCMHNFWTAIFKSPVFECGLCLNQVDDWLWCIMCWCTIMQPITRYCWCISGAITTVVVSPNSRYIASASYDKTVRVWLTRTAECLHVLTGWCSLVTPLYRPLMISFCKHFINIYFLIFIVFCVDLFMSFLMVHSRLVLTNYIIK